MAPASETSTDVPQPSRRQERAMSGIGSCCGGCCGKSLPRFAGLPPALGITTMLPCAFLTEPLQNCCDWQRHSRARVRNLPHRFRPSASCHVRPPTPDDCPNLCVIRRTDAEILQRRPGPAVRAGLALEVGLGGRLQVFAQPRGQAARGGLGLARKHLTCYLVFDRQGDVGPRLRPRPASAPRSRRAAAHAATPPAPRSLRGPAAYG